MNIPGPAFSLVTYDAVGVDEMLGGVGTDTVGSESEGVFIHDNIHLL